MDVEEMLAREEIRHLMATYNQAGDSGKRELFESVFTVDAVLESPLSRYEGRDAIVEGLFARTDRSQPGSEKPRLSFLRHNLTTSRIGFTSPVEARGRTYFFVVTDIGPDHSGVYVDRFRKEAGRWLIANREVRLDFVAENAIFAPGMRERVMADRAARRAEQQRWDPLESQQNEHAS